MGLLDKVKSLLTNKDKSYVDGLEKTRNSINLGLNLLNKKYNHINDAYFEDLEELLITADIGVKTVINFVDRLKKRVSEEKITDPNLIREIIVDELFIIYVNNEILVNKINFNDNMTTILVVGVNGVGKTTSIAKLGYQLSLKNKKVLMIAGDTFRAGAISQLETWGERLNIPVYVGKNTDPASVIYEGLEYGKANNFDVVLIDTAGRLQSKDYLMQELNKVNKVINNLVGKVDETLLVIDATTGQNGISQAKSFSEITDITGIILTKVDGTAKGGIVLAIKEEVGIPVKYIGLGETKDDLKVFDIENYIYSLIKED
jgi:fused signal recognition particle receptor